MTCTPSCELSCGLSGGTKWVSMRSPNVPNQSTERADVTVMAPSSHKKLAWAVIRQNRLNMREKATHAEQTLYAKAVTSRKQQALGHVQQASTVKPRHADTSGIVARGSSAAAHSQQWHLKPACFASGLEKASKPFHAPAQSKPLSSATVEECCSAAATSCGARCLTCSLEFRPAKWLRTLMIQSGVAQYCDLCQNGGTRCVSPDATPLGIGPGVSDTRTPCAAGR